MLSSLVLSVSENLRQGRKSYYLAILLPIFRDIFFHSCDTEIHSSKNGLLFFSVISITQEGFMCLLKVHLYFNLLVLCFRLQRWRSYYYKSIILCSSVTGVVQKRPDAVTFGA